MKLPIRELTLMAVLPMSSWAIAADSTTPSVTPDEAFNRLKAGKERFANSKMSARQTCGRASRGNGERAASGRHHCCLC
jgi:hypothetical protein